MPKFRIHGWLDAKGSGDIRDSANTAEMAIEKAIGMPKIHVDHVIITDPDGREYSVSEFYEKISAKNGAR